jgi:cytochrome c oxidase subunit 2
MVHRRTLLKWATGLGLALFAGAAALHVAIGAADPVIKVVAKRFDYAPSVIKLKKGVPVVLEFTTQDVVMGFSAPDFATRADIIPDRVTRVRIIPDKTGTFTFVCDIFCGTGHEQMEGTIEVVD